MSISQDSVVDDPCKNKVCTLHSGSRTPINVHEWALESHKSHVEQLNNNVYREGSLQPYGRLRPDCTYTCGSFQSAYSTGEEIRAHSGGEATMSFCKGMKQPLADLQLLQPETKETASEPILWTPLKTPSMLEGDVPQQQMTKHIKIGCLFSFRKEGFRKLRDLVGTAKTNSNTIYGGSWQGQAYFSRTLAPQTR